MLKFLFDRRISYYSYSKNPRVNNDTYLPTYVLTYLIFKATRFLTHNFIVLYEVT